MASKLRSIVAGKKGNNNKKNHRKKRRKMGKGREE